MFLKWTVANSLCWKERNMALSYACAMEAGTKRPKRMVLGAESSHDSHSIPIFPRQASRGFQFHSERLGAVTQIKPLSWTHRTNKAGLYPLPGTWSFSSISHKILNMESGCEGPWREFQPWLKGHGAHTLVASYLALHLTAKSILSLWQLLLLSLWSAPSW